MYIVLGRWVWNGPSDWQEYSEANNIVPKEERFFVVIALVLLYWVNDVH